MKNINLKTMYSEEELNKWDVVFHKDVWDKYNDEKPNVGDYLEYDEIRIVEEDDYCYFFKLIKTVNLILDTSSSCIDSVEKNINKITSILFEKYERINLIEVDTNNIINRIIDDKSVININNSGGGDNMQKAFDLIINDKKMQKNNIFVYTDGYIDKININNYDKEIYQIFTEDFDTHSKKIDIDYLNFELYYFNLN
jgi:hypothetical protein